MLFYFCNLLLFVACIQKIIPARQSATEIQKRINFLQECRLSPGYGAEQAFGFTSFYRGRSRNMRSHFFAVHPNAILDPRYTAIITMQNLESTATVKGMTFIPATPIISA